MDSCNRKTGGELRPGLFEFLMQRVASVDFFPGYNGMTITELDLDYAVGCVEATGTNLNFVGNLHGGVLLTLADTVCGAAVATRMRLCTTVDCTMNFLRPGHAGTKIICTATPERVGGTIAVYRVVLTDGEGIVIATGSYTFFLLDDIPEEMLAL